MYLSIIDLPAGRTARLDERMRPMWVHVITDMGDSFKFKHTTFSKDRQTLRAIMAADYDDARVIKTSLVAR
jgi:hypothetical protein